MSVRQFHNRRNLNGISVRFPDRTTAKFRRAQRALKITTLNKLLAELAAQGLQLTKRVSLDMSIPAELEAMRANPIVVECFNSILDMEQSSIPNTKTYPRWVIGADPLLTETANDLRCSRGQVIQEAIQTSLMFVCDRTNPLPAFLRLTWGSRDIKNQWLLASRT